MSSEIHQNDIGTIFIVTITEDSVATDISSATTKQIIIKKPSGTTLTKTASFTTDGTDGKIQYTTISGDLDEVGNYQIQARIVMTAGTFYSDIELFKVYRNL